MKYDYREENSRSFTVRGLVVGSTLKPLRNLCFPTGRGDVSDYQIVDIFDTVKFSSMTVPPLLVPLYMYTFTSSCIIPITETLIGAG